MAMSQAVFIYVAMIFSLSTFCQLGEELTRQVTNLMSYVINLLFHIVQFRRGKRVYHLIAALHTVH
jgi:hypothetical protein